MDFLRCGRLFIRPCLSGRAERMPGKVPANTKEQWRLEGSDPNPNNFVYRFSPSLFAQATHNLGVCFLTPLPSPLVPCNYPCKVLFPQGSFPSSSWVLWEGMGKCWKFPSTLFFYPRVRFKEKDGENFKFLCFLKLML